MMLYGWLSTEAGLQQQETTSEKWFSWVRYTKLSNVEPVKSLRGMTYMSLRKLLVFLLLTVTNLLDASSYASQSLVETVDGYVVEFRKGKLFLTNLRQGSVVENNEKFPLIEAVLLNEKATFSRGNIFLTPKIKAVGVFASPNLIRKSDKHLTQEYKIIGKCRGTFRIDFMSVSNSSIEIKAEILPPKDKKSTSCNAIKFSYLNLEDEIYSGIGTQVTHLNLNGHKFSSLSQEQGHGKGKQPITWIGNKLGKGAGGLKNFSYAAIPHYISNKGRSFWVDSIDHVHFDFKDKSGTVVLTSKPELNLRINHHLEPKKMVEEFSKKFGVMRALPDWVHKGAMLGIQGGREKIDHALKLLDQHDASISSVWIQDWVGMRSTLFSERLKWNWKLDRTTYPHWEKLVDDYRAKGLEVATYFNPRLITGKECSDPCDFDEALRYGYVVNNKKGNPYFIGNGGFDFVKVDLANPEAVDWYQSRIRDHLKMAPVSGWMVDFSESLPFDARLHGGVDGREYHNRYVDIWGKMNREVADDILGDKAFLFMRGGVLGSHKYVNAHWLGDQLMSWDKYDGMQSALIGSITGGLSGASVNHSDVGGMIRVSVLGYRITRDRLLFLKWLQMNAFSPILRTHEGTSPTLVHQFDSDEYTLKQFAYYTKVFSLLFDYRKSLLALAQKTGIPMMRGLFMEYPNDPRAWVVDDQIMLGSDVLVAPIFDKKQKGRAVYLPKGEWVNIFTGKLYAMDNSGDILVKGALESIPVFVKPKSEVGQRLIKYISENKPPQLKQ
jgi:sulfoquinovosidase